MFSNRDDVLRRHAEDAEYIKKLREKNGRLKKEVEKREITSQAQRSALLHSQAKSHETQENRSVLQIVELLSNLPKTDPDYIETQSYRNLKERIPFDFSKTKNAQIALTGMPGIGKTELATCYANEYKKQLAQSENAPIIRILGAESADSLIRSYVELLEALKITLSREKEANDQFYKKVLLNVSSQLKMKPGSLLIFDNADNFQTIKNLLPTDACFYMLVTSQQENFFLTGNLKMEPFSESDALSLMKKIIGEKFDDSAKDVVKELESLPLSIKIASYYICQDDITCREYLDVLGKNAGLIRTKEEEIAKKSSYTKTQWLAIKLAVQKIRSSNKIDIDDVLLLCSFLPSDYISHDTLIRYLQNKYPQKAVTNLEIELANLIGIMSNYSILSKERRSEKIYLYKAHGIVQKVVQETLCEQYPNTGRCKEYVEKMDRLISVLNELALDRMHISTEQENWLRQAECVLGNIDNFSKVVVETGFSQSGTALLYANLGETKHNLGDYKKALEYKKKALKIFEATLEKNHQNIIASLSSIGITYNDLGEHEKALECLKQALELERSKVGLAGYHLSVTTLLDNIGMTYNNLGNHEKALEYLKEAIKIRKDALGESDPDVATLLMNVGVIHNALREHAIALEYFEQALKIWEAALGENNLYVAILLDNIGVAYDALGERERALKCKEQALNTCITILGRNHPHVARSLNNIGYTYHAFGEHKKALEYFMQALKIEEGALGGNHPNVATSLRNIGMVYSALGMHGEALEYEKRALGIVAILEKNWKNLLKVVTSLNDIGITYKALGNHGKALEYFEQALKIWEATLGKDHPNVATSLSNVGMAYCALGNHEKALEHLNRAAEIFGTLFGENDPQTQYVINGIQVVKNNASQETETLTDRQSDNVATVVEKRKNKQPDGRKGSGNCVIKQERQTVKEPANQLGISSPEEGLFVTLPSIFHADGGAMTIAILKAIRETAGSVEEKAGKLRELIEQNARYELDFSNTDFSQTDIEVLFTALRGNKIVGSIKFPAIGEQGAKKICEMLYASNTEKNDALECITIKDFDIDKNERLASWLQSSKRSMEDLLEEAEEYGQLSGCNLYFMPDFEQGSHTTEWLIKNDRANSHIIGKNNAVFRVRYDGRSLYCECKNNTVPLLDKISDNPNSPSKLILTYEQRTQLKRNIRSNGGDPYGENYDKALTTVKKILDYSCVHPKALRYKACVLQEQANNFIQVTTEIGREIEMCGKDEDNQKKKRKHTFYMKAVESYDELCVLVEQHKSHFSEINVIKSVITQLDKIICYAVFCGRINFIKYAERVNPGCIKQCKDSSVYTFRAEDLFQLLVVGYLYTLKENSESNYRQNNSSVRDIHQEFHDVLKILSSICTNEFPAKIYRFKLDDSAFILDDYDEVFEKVGATLAQFLAMRAPMGRNENNITSKSKTNPLLDALFSNASNNLPGWGLNLLQLLVVAQKRYEMAVYLLSKYKHIFSNLRLTLNSKLDLAKIGIKIHSGTAKLDGLTLLQILVYRYYHLYQETSIELMKVIIQEGAELDEPYPDGLKYSGWLPIHIAILWFKRGRGNGEELEFLLLHSNSMFSKPFPSLEEDPDNDYLKNIMPFHSLIYPSAEDPTYEQASTDYQRVTMSCMHKWLYLFLHKKYVWFYRKKDGSELLERFPEWIESDKSDSAEFPSELPDNFLVSIAQHSKIFIKHTESGSECDGLRIGSPLHIAVLSKNIAAVEFLIKKIIERNMHYLLYLPDSQGDTPYALTEQRSDSQQYDEKLKIIKCALSAVMNKDQEEKARNKVREIIVEANVFSNGYDLLGRVIYYFDRSQEKDYLQVIAFLLVLGADIDRFQPSNQKTNRELAKNKKNTALLKLINKCPEKTKEVKNREEKNMFTNLEKKSPTFEQNSGRENTSSVALVVQSDQSNLMVAPLAEFCKKVNSMTLELREYSKAIVEANDPVKFGVKKNSLCYEIVKLGNEKGGDEAKLLSKVKGMDLDQVIDEKDDKFNFSPLHWCAVFNCSTIAKYLCSKGFELSKRDRFGLNPMHVAAVIGNRAFLQERLCKSCGLSDVIIGFKLTSGENIQVKLNELHLAFIGQHIGIVRDIFRLHDETGACIEKDVKYIGNLLHLIIYAANVCGAEEKQIMIELMRLVLYRYQVNDIKSMLLESKSNCEECSPLQLAAKCGQIGLFGELIHYMELHVEQAAGLEEKERAFYVAAKNGKREVIELFLEYYCFTPESKHADYNDTLIFLELHKEEPCYKRIKNLIDSAGRKKHFEQYNPPNPKDTPYESLVLSGGGGKGFAFPSALQSFKMCCEKRSKENPNEMRQNALRFDRLIRVAGTSAGAMFAMALAIGYTTEELEEKLDYDFSEFIENDLVKDVVKKMDSQGPMSEVIDKALKSFELELGKIREAYDKIGKSSWPVLRAGVEFLKHPWALYEETRGAIRRIKDIEKTFNGFSSGKKVCAFLKRLLHAKGLSEDLTFGQLAELVKGDNRKYKHLHIAVTNLSLGHFKVLSSENSAYKNYIILDAVRASMSYPIIFMPHQLRIKEGMQTETLTDEYVDGGVLRNYLIDEFDFKKYTDTDAMGDPNHPHLNERTIGFCFKEPVQEKSDMVENGKSEGLLGRIGAFAHIYLQAETLISSYMGRAYHRSIELDIKGITTFTFRKLSEEAKKALEKQTNVAIYGYFGYPKDSVKPFISGLPKQEMLQNRMVHLWYDNDEMKKLFDHYLKSITDVDRFDPFHGTSAALTDNLKQFGKERREKLEKGEKVKDRLFIPLSINVKGCENEAFNHWVLFSIVFYRDMRPPSIGYFDPKGNEMPPYIERVLDNDFLCKGSNKVLSQDVVEHVQSDDDNCGLWVIEAARAWAIGGPLPNRDLNINAVREEHGKICPSINRSLIISDGKKLNSHMLFKNPTSNEEEKIDDFDKDQPNSNQGSLRPTQGSD